VHFNWTNASCTPNLQAVCEHLKDAILGASLPFEFEGDCVSLDIPRGGIVKRDWSITPLVPLVVSPLFSVMWKSLIGMLRIALH